MATTVDDSNMMKILFALEEQHPTYRADVSVLFGKYILREGVNTDLLTLHAASGTPPPWGGGGLHTVPGSHSRLGKHFRTLKNDVRILWLGGRGYDALQVRDKTLCALLGLIAARLHRIPFYYWMSFLMAEAWMNFAEERGRSVGWLRWTFAWLRGRAMRLMLYRIILRNADHVFVQSDQMRSYLSERGVESRRMTVVPMGVDNDALAGEGAIGGSSLFADPTFVYLGSLSRGRRPDLMIDAIDIVRAIIPNVRLLLIGDSDEEADRIWLRTLIRERRLSDCVELTGWLPMQDGWALARRCVAGLSPIPRNALLDVGSPTKAVEYFGLGLPVIGNDQPDQKVVLSGAGASCVPFTAQGFADGMLDVIAYPERYREQGRRGRAWVGRQRGYAVLAEQVARVYKSNGGAEKNADPYLS